MDQARINELLNQITNHQIIQLKPTIRYFDVAAFKRKEAYELSKTRDPERLLKQKKYSAKNYAKRKLANQNAPVVHKEPTSPEERKRQLRAASMKNYAKKKDDPEYMRKRREAAAARYETRKNDPDFMEKQRASAAAYYAKKRNETGEDLN